MKTKKLLLICLIICACVLCVVAFVGCKHTHEWDKGSVTTKPTCFSLGQKTFSCTKCDEQRVEEVNMLEHNLKTVPAKTSPCTEVGWEEYEYCQREGCDYSTYVEISAHANHDLKTIPAQSPTCEQIGWEEYQVCQREGCEYTTYQQIPKHNVQNGSCVNCLLPLTTSGIECVKNKDGTYTAVGIGTFNGGQLVFGIYKDSVISAIAEEAFIGCNELVSVVISSTVTTIKEGAFKRCDAIQNLTIAGSVKTISSGAFQACVSLLNLTIKEGVQVIGENAFYNCDALTEVVLPNSIITVGDSAFYGCEGLVNITLGEKVQTIGDNAFYSDLNLTTIDLGNSLKEIGKNAFYDCQKLTEIALPDSVTSIGSYAFYNAYELVACKMSKNLTTIGMYAFQNCFELTSVTIPDGVTTIEKCVFQHCYKLKSLKIGTGVKSIQDDAFSDCYRLAQVVNNSPHITITKGSQKDGMAGFYAIQVFNSDDTFVEGYYQQNGFVLYDDGKDVYLVDYVGQESVLVLPETITKINQYAFYYTFGVTSVTIPMEVDCIGYGAFAYCYDLEKVTFLNTKGWRVSKTSDFKESETINTADDKENSINLQRWYRAYWWRRG